MHRLRAVALALLIGCVVNAPASDPAAQLQQCDECWRFRVEGSELLSLSAKKVARRKDLTRYVKSIEARSDGMVILTVDRPLYEIKSDKLAAMFPKWNFYLVRYQMKKHPRYKGAIAIADGLYNVVGLDDRGERAEFFGYGNYDEFGSFLASRGVRLRDTEEARQVWAAYCHVYRKGWPRSEPRREGPGLWHLEPHVVRDLEYFYEIRTNEEGTVVSGTLHSRAASAKTSEKK